MWNGGAFLPGSAIFSCYPSHHCSFFFLWISFCLGLFTAVVRANSPEAGTVGGNPRGVLPSEGFGARQLRRSSGELGPRKNAQRDGSGGLERLFYRPEVLIPSSVCVKPIGLWMK